MRGVGAPSTVLIAGGGIAGIAAALRLAEHDVRVTLVETRKKLGGRATSFTDSRTGLVLDNCQHVMLGCCTNFADLLRRLGAADMIRWHREQYWVEAGGRVSTIRRSALPAPLQFAWSMLRAPLLTLAEAAAVGRACAAILRADRREYQDITFGAYLRGLRPPQSERLIARFWSPVIVSACNMDVDRVAASAALHVFQEGFLAHPHAADIGVPAAPLVRLYDRAEEVIRAAGGRIELGESVVHLDATSLTTGEGRRLEAECAVCAVPVERVNRIVDERIRASDPRFAPLDRFTHSPILGVHLLFDRPVLNLPHAVLVERPTQWVFRKDDEGRAVHAVVSAADEWVGLPEDQIVQRVAADIAACFPDVRLGEPGGASIVSARAVKEKRATFAPIPGIDRLRPGPLPPGATSARGHVVLAGDYTATGWPATMEGAARSGYAAAAAVLGVPAEEMVAPSLRPAAIPRALAAC